MYGRDQQLVQLQVQEPPQAPALVTAIMVTARSVNLKWQARAGDSAEVSKYIVEYMEYDGPWHEMELSNPPQFTALIENLKPATRYVFRVIAEGPAGQSVPSEELAVKTELQRPAGAPLNLSARPLSSTDILVTWMPPLAELRHGEIQGYNIGYKTFTVANSNNYNFTSISGDGDDGTGELMISNLMKYTRYTIVIQAFNQVGSGPLSEPTTAQTLEDGLFVFFAIYSVTTRSKKKYLPNTTVPSHPPESIRCAPLTSQSLQISWQSPPTHHTNGLLQGYKINFEFVAEVIGMENDEMDSRKTTDLTIVLSGLRKFTNYSIQVLAFTRMGDGVFSTPLYCQTEEDGNLMTFN